MKSIREKINEILDEFDVSSDNKGILEINYSRHKETALMLLEYLECNRELMMQKEKYRELRTTRVWEQLCRIMIYFNLDAPFPYCDPKPWEIIPESQKKVIR